MTSTRTLAGCPCLSGLPYDDCCSPFHRGDALPPTAERLMRSRYSAYALGNAAYLLKTWHPVGRPKSLQLDPDQQWLSLEILGRTAGGLLDDRGTVHYRARYSENGVRGEQIENSAFVREGKRWLYVGVAE